MTAHNNNYPYTKNDLLRMILLIQDEHTVQGVANKMGRGYKAISTFLSAVGLPYTNIRKMLRSGMYPEQIASSTNYFDQPAPKPVVASNGVATSSDMQEILFRLSVIAGNDELLKKARIAIEEAVTC